MISKSPATSGRASQELKNAAVECRRRIEENEKIVLELQAQIVGLQEQNAEDRRQCELHEKDAREELFKEQCNERQKLFQTIFLNSSHILKDLRKKVSRFQPFENVHDTEKSVNANFFDSQLFKSILWDTVAGDSSAFRQEISRSIENLSCDIHEDDLKKLETDPLAKMKSYAFHRDGFNFSDGSSALTIPSTAAVKTTTSTSETLAENDVANFLEATPNAESIEDATSWARSIAIEALQSMEHVQKEPATHTQPPLHCSGQDATIGNLTEHEQPAPFEKRVEEDAHGGKRKRDQPSLVLCKKSPAIEIIVPKTISPQKRAQSELSIASDGSDVPLAKKAKETKNANDTDDNMSIRTRKFVNSVTKLIREGHSVDQELKCARCDNEPFNPRVMDCGHLYCQRCLVGMRKVSNIGSSKEQYGMKCVSKKCTRNVGYASIISSQELQALKDRCIGHLHS